VIETPGAGAPQSPWWYRNRSSVFGTLYGAAFWIPILIDSITHSAYLPTIILIGNNLQSDELVNALFCVALFLVFLCFVIRLWGSSYLQSAIVWNADAKAEKFFIEGPFRYTRNPLYFGNLFMAIGFAMIAPPIGSVFLLITNALLINGLIVHEEALLRARFGDAFERYCAEVPRYLPRLRPVPSNGTLKPSLAQGLLTETFTLGLFLGMCCFFAPMPYGLFGFVAFFALGIVSQRFFARLAS
jgi:protein-S-isoprenylcysteine O-methyltransferase Ste14